MPDYNEIRQQLNSSREEKERAEKELFKKKESLRKISREKDRIIRSSDKNNPEDARNLRRLKQTEAVLTSDVNEWKEVLDSRIRDESRIFKEFTPLADPREKISSLKDSIPIFLMPLRLETRFKKMDTGGGEQHQLWMRAYPDECQVDTFEEILSETEIRNAKAYWFLVWQAAGVEEHERAAWRNLVSNHGSGRAAYIIDQYKPIDPKEKPAEKGEKDVFLIIGIEQLPSEELQITIREYWSSYWKLAENPEKLEELNKKLMESMGQEQAYEIQEEYRPRNLNQKPQAPFAREDMVLNVMFLRFPASEEVNTKQQSWSQAPKSHTMPDRLVFTGIKNGEEVFSVLGNGIPSPLIVGPDPSDDPESQFKVENGDLQIHEDMRWMVDFDNAISKGMGIKIPLTKEQWNAGFDKVLVLGLKLTADQQEGKKLLENLITHHGSSRKGFEILPQGTPTNNTEKKNAGNGHKDDPDESFERLKKDRLFTPQQDWMLKSDGQWLAEWLGIDYEVLYKVRNSDQKDQSEARAMNTALWSGTLGYMMETLMQPVFDENTIDSSREFFNQMISGRGVVPAIKIGKQPYGILPTTDFSNIGWMKKTVHHRRGTHAQPGSEDAFLLELYQFLKQVDQDWAPFLEKVSYVGKEGDAHQILLDAVGLNPVSVEFFQRNAKSAEDIYNQFKILGFGGAIIAYFLTGTYKESGKNLLKKFGYNKEELPDMLSKFFLSKQNKLKGPLIDDVPLSESKPVRNYTPDPDAKNYLEWLIQAANTSHDALRKQEGFTDKEIPNSLLYLMLHHSLDLNYIESSYRLFENAGLMTKEEVFKKKMEPPFLHMENNKKETESKWNHLYQKNSKITNDENLLVGDYIPKVITSHKATTYLKEQLKALEILKDSPTARLERVFAEHIDCCSYRLDAWKGGIMNYQLATMRFTNNEVRNTEPYNKGLYLGAYGYIENLRPENKNLSPVSLEGELSDIFEDGTSPLMRDDKNGGYITAPSLNHGVTAAILRNGYMSNATKENPDLLKVNLSSERVRKALSIIEGIRGGQSLGALLGYYLERGLHDSHPGLELDYYIYHIRKAFPFRANKLKETKVEEDSDTPVEALEARNVVDGYALINHIKKTGNDTYPFGKNFLPMPDEGGALEQDILDAINQEVKKIQDWNDAVADVAIAESVHQIVQGNYDRGASTLETYAKGNFPPIPEVIQTPRSGTNITHRVGLHFSATADPSKSPYDKIPISPRLEGEPAINEWLADILPSPDEVVCKYSFVDPVDSSIREGIVSQEELGLQPYDLLYILDPENDQAMSELDDRIMLYALDKENVRPDVDITIQYTAGIISPQLSFFQLAPLMRNLRKILVSSKALEPTDMMRPSESNEEKNTNYSLPEARIDLLKSRMVSIQSSLQSYHSNITSLTNDVGTNKEEINNQIDNLCNNLLPILQEAGLTGLSQTGRGFIISRKREIFKAIIRKLDDLLNRWKEKDDRFTDLKNEYGALPLATAEKDRVALLRNAERVVSSKPYRFTDTDNSDSFEPIVLSKKTLFDAKKKILSDLRDTETTFLSTLIFLIGDQLPLSEYDLETFAIKEEKNLVVLLAEDLAVQADSLLKDIDSRIKKADKLVNEAKSSSNNKKKIEAIEEAGKAYMGDDFKMVPIFTLPEPASAEFENTYNDKDQLLDYQISTEKVDFPIDDWLYGVARVREPLQHWENIVILSEAFNDKELSLHPVQLPYKPNDHWLALSYPEDYVIDNDKILYTAYYSKAFNKDEQQCGLLLDEWTEVIPSKEETAGVSFHYDKPNNEPPQVMLLAMPTDFRGEWAWTDLVNVVLDTFEQAKKRAIEPNHIDSSDYARFLPGTVSSMTTHPITASLNYSFNNKVYKFLNKEEQE